MIVRPGNIYSFQYLNDKPVTWVVDVANVKADKVHMHKQRDGKPKEMSLKRFVSLYERYGVDLEGR
ncbi:hypothetical protein J2T13_003628 [Paenibacillus sp. DS2015]|uniref:hypothetical protein n=1 Tax=Paenibacillus sp. DS2015 TaxID=3373917 RepID=UPI003D254E54